VRLAWSFGESVKVGPSAYSHASGRCARMQTRPAVRVPNSTPPISAPPCRSEKNASMAATRISSSTVSDESIALSHMWVSAVSTN
jgi:hypothetical protein